MLQIQHFIYCRSRTWIAVSGPDQQCPCTSASQPVISVTAVWCPVTFTCSVSACTRGVVTWHGRWRLGFVYFTRFIAWLCGGAENVGLISNDKAAGVETGNCGTCK